MDERQRRDGVVRPASWRALATHWRGEQTLARSVFGFFLPPFLAAWWLLDPLVGLVEDHAAFAYGLVAAYALVVWLPLLLVLGTGVMRSCERYLLHYGNPVLGRLVQALVIAAVLAAVLETVAAVQRIGARANAIEFDHRWQAQTRRVYDISMLGEGVARLAGDMQNGTTRALEHWLDQHPGITALVLDSTGGRVYEGRGVARVIRERDLDTYSLTGCYSACTTAYIAGRRRYLAAGARLGFHQYRYDSVKALGYLDADAEQEKDRRWYRDRQIDDGFLARVFDKPGNEMWFPTPGELLAAGVVHQVVDTDTLPLPTP